MKKKQELVNFKKKIHGITLIALVVTIIVLLILSAIVINFTIGQNGIFTRAENAKERYEYASVNEEKELNKTVNFIDKYINETSQGEKTLLEMYNKAIEDKCTNSDGMCDRTDHLHIGDYVSFKNPTNVSATANATDTGCEENQTYTINEERNQVNWRVLGLDEETGGIKLISGIPLRRNETRGYFDIKGAQAYEKGYLVPDQICNSLYGSQTYVAKARSVKQKDIDELMGITTIEDIRRVDRFTYYGEYKYNDSYSIDNAYTPESYLAEKNNGEPEGNRRGTISGIVDGYYYTVNSSDEEGVPYVTLDNPRIYNMVFGDENSGKLTYIFSSRGVCVYPEDPVYEIEECASFGIGGVNLEYGDTAGVSTTGVFYSDASDVIDLPNMGIRPVIVLEKEVTSKQIPKIPDQKEPLWLLLI